MFYKKELCMKYNHMILVSGFAAALIISLTICDQLKLKKTDNTSQQEGKRSMNRYTTDSGLMYEIMQEGTGASPKKGTAVTVHYTGWLDDNGQLGRKFDSSVDRNEPFRFIIGIGQVIKGWDEGVLSMKEGEKRRLIIPAQLGYGARGAGNVIPANATLIFDVELIKAS